jgi:hypothetical protein
MIGKPADGAQFRSRTRPVPGRTGLPYERAQEADIRAVGGTINQYRGAAELDYGSSKVKVVKSALEGDSRCVQTLAPVADDGTSAVKTHAAGSMGGPQDRRRRPVLWRCLPAPGGR